MKQLWLLEPALSTVNLYSVYTAYPCLWFIHQEIFLCAHVFSYCISWLNYSLSSISKKKTAVNLLPIIRKKDYWSRWYSWEFNTKTELKQWILIRLDLIINNASSLFLSLFLYLATYLFTLSVKISMTAVICTTYYKE